MTISTRIERGDRYVCVRDDPWSPAKGVPAVHPDARELRQYDNHPCGDLVDYECPHCGKRFTVELPQ